LFQLCLPATCHEGKLKAANEKKDECPKEEMVGTVTPPSPVAQNGTTALAVRTRPDGVLRFDLLKALLKAIAMMFACVAS
jgi:hypothetical protein